MKYVKIISASLGAAVIVTAGLMLGACSEKNEPQKLDPELDVIVDENYSGIDLSNLRVSVGGDEKMGSVSYTRNEDSIAFSAKPVSGYSFIGWYTTNDYTGHQVSTAAEYIATESEIEKIMQNGTAVLFARFLKDYKITYDLRLGEFVGAAAKSTYNTSDEPQPLADNVSKENCRFIGWKLSQTGQTVTELPADIEGDITLTAVWDDVSVDKNEFSNTVWQISNGIMGCHAAFIFNADGTLDIFSYNGDENRPYINSGAALKMKYDFDNLFANKDQISPKDILNVKYDCTRSYYEYKVTENGCEIIPTVELAESAYRNALNTVFGDIRYFLERNGDGNMTFIAEIPEKVTYGGVQYTLSDWLAFVVNNMYAELPDSSQIEYEYVKMSQELILEKVADNVTDYEFSAFTTNEVLCGSFEYGSEYMFEGTNVILEKEDGKYGYLSAAFQRGEDVYISFINVDLFEIGIGSVRFWNVSDFTQIDPPEIIELYRRTL